MNKFKYPYWLFLLFLFFLYGPLQIYTSRLQLTIGVLVILGVLIYVVLIRKFYGATAHRWPIKNITWSTLLFLLYMIMSSGYGLYRGNSAWAIMGDVFPFFEFVAFAMVTLFVVREQKQINSIAFVLLAALTLKALWILYLFFTGQLLSMQLAFSEHASMVEIGDIVSGRPFDPNITLITPCVLLYLTIFPKGISKWLLIFILFFFLGFAVLSFTRSIWIGITISIFLMILLVSLYVDKKKGLKIIGFITLFSFVLAMAINVISVEGESLYSLLTERIFHTVEQLDTKLGTLRIFEIQDALDDFSRNFMFGKGMGGTLETLSREGVEAIDEQKTFIHNYPMALLLKLGSVGMISLISVLFVLVKRSLLILKKSKGTNAYFFGISFLVFLTGFLIFINFQPIVVAYHTFALLGLIFSLMVIQGNVPRRKDMYG